MTDRPESPERMSLSRWSRRKLAASATPGNVAAAPGAPAPSAPATPTAATGSHDAPSPSAQSPAQLPTQLPIELPSIDSLGFDSDFTPFLRPGVDETLKRAALKQLFRDPRFNVMDGLDTYIDDYTKADPIEPDVLADLLKRGFGTGSETGEQEPAATNDVAPPAAAADGPPAAAQLSSAPRPESGQPPSGEAAGRDGTAATRGGAAEDHGGR